MIVLRIVRTALGVPFICATMAVHALIIMIFGERAASEAALRSWCRIFLWTTGANVQRIGGERLDPKKNYVFVSNHTSMIDIPAILALTPTPLRFIAKKELTYVPFFGFAARRMGHVFIDRKDKHAATKAIRRRIEKGFDTGVALFFFAEGTRSTTDELLPFKKGSAIAAIETGLDVVPIGIAGARRVMPPKGVALFNPGPVAVVFGEPIPVAGYTLDQRDALVAVQRAAVEGVVAQARRAIDPSK